MESNKEPNRQQLQEFLLKKYADKFDIEEYRKFAVYKVPNGHVSLQFSELVCVTGSYEEGVSEIKWRLKYLVTKDKNVVQQNDKRFATFEDDSETGKTMKDYMDITFDEYEGNYFIQEIFMAPSANIPNKISNSLVIKK